MKHSVFDLLCTSLIPELSTDISAGSSCNKKLILVTVAAVRAFPDQLAGIIGNDLDLTIVSTVFAVVTLGIQLSIHDVLIDKLHHRQNSWNVGLQIWYFHITDGSARRKLLEF